MVQKNKTKIDTLNMKRLPSFKELNMCEWLNNDNTSMVLNDKLKLCRKALEPHGFHLSKTEYMES